MAKDLDLADDTTDLPRTNRMTTCVGNFGGYAGRAIRWLPTRNGLLTAMHEGPPSALRLLWSFGKSPPFVLGEARCPGGGSDPPQLQIRGWVTFELREPLVRALVSRAWPAVRLHYEGATMQWLTSATALLGVIDGRPQVLAPPMNGQHLSEPWIVVHGHSGAEDTAVLLTFSRRVRTIGRIADGYELTFEGPGAVHAMPLEGIKRRLSGDTPLTDWIAKARSWVAPLLAFPTACTESAEVAGDKCVVLATFTHEALTDDWGNIGEPLAPFPPAVAAAAMAGYPVTLPGGLVKDSAQRNIPTLYGPFQYVPGAEYTYSLPLAVASDDIPIPSRAQDPSSEPIRDELLRIVDAIGAPTENYVDNNLRIVAFLADAFPELDAGRRARADTFASAALAGALTTLVEAVEPFTGQTWWTLDKTWRSHFADTDPPWGKDHERFDSEFYNGQALSALEAFTRIDPNETERYFEKATQLYAYNQIFFDWATGSVLTHATGDTANIDGIHFAWEGMQAMARMARRLGANALCNDALYRAARQQAALYATWHHAAWVQRWDYAVGHVSGGRLAASDVDTTGPIDAYVEDYGAAMLQFESFWECTCFLFYANRPLFEFYRQYGLLPRIKTLEYEIMPRFHPRWGDGNAVIPHPENGQEYYGTSWTAAHLMTRSRLFGDCSETLFAAYEASKSTHGAATWYNMQLPQIAGPLMLALLEGAAVVRPQRA